MTPSKPGLTLKEKTKRPGVNVRAHVAATCRASRSCRRSRCRRIPRFGAGDIQRIGEQGHSIEVAARRSRARDRFAPARPRLRRSPPPRSSVPWQSVSVRGRMVRNDLKPVPGRSISVVNSSIASQPGAVAVAADQIFDVAGIGQRAVTAVRFEVKRDAQIVRRHHVHQRRNEPVDVAALPPPAHVDRAGTRVLDPPGVLLEDRRGRRIGTPRAAERSWLRGQPAAAEWIRPSAGWDSRRTRRQASKMKCRRRSLKRRESDRPGAPCAASAALLEEPKGFNELKGAPNATLIPAATPSPGTIVARLS